MMHDDTLKTEVIKMNILDTDDINFNIQDRGDISFTMEGQGGGTTNYNQLSNKPQINGVTLIGNKLDYELYLQHIMDEITEQDIDRIIYG